MRGMAAFILDLPDGREVADEAVSDAFVDTGFSVLAIRGLTAAQAKLAMSSAWAEPAAGSTRLIVAFDAWPRTPALAERLRHGPLDNQRTLKALRRVRKRLGCARRRGAGRAYLTVTVNSAQAVETARECGLQTAALESAATSIVESVSLPVPVVRQIASGYLRARLDVIEAGGRQVVRKTFLPSFAGYARREIEARARLAPILPFVDPVLEAGDNYFTIPLYRAPVLAGPNSLRLHPLAHARKAIEVMRGLYESGYAMLDCNSHSILYAPDGSARVVDMEYVHKYDIRPATFEESFDVAGPPVGSKFPGAHIADSFTRRWKPWIGVSFEDLMGRPAAVLFAKRVAFVLARRVPLLLSVSLRDGFRTLRDLTIGGVRGFLLHRHPDRLSL